MAKKRPSAKLVETLLAICGGDPEAATTLGLDGVMGEMLEVDIDNDAACRDVCRKMLEVLIVRPGTGDEEIMRRLLRGLYPTLYPLGKRRKKKA